MTKATDKSRAQTLKGRVGRPAKRQRLQDLPTDLRGPSQNRYGGHQTSRLRGFKGAEYRVYGLGRVFNDEEKQSVIDQLRERGEIE